MFNWVAPRSASYFTGCAFIVCIGVFLIGCQRSNPDCRNEVDVSNIQVTLKIQRLEQEMFQLKSRETIRAFLKKYPEFNQRFLKNNRAVSDSMVVLALEQMTSNLFLDTLYKDVQKIYTDNEIALLEKELADAFRHIKYYYPSFKIPKVYTAITGLGSFFGNDLYVSQDMIVISLDFFLGKQARYRPPDMPQYIWRRYQKSYIAPTIALYISGAYNKTDMKDETILAEMVYYGKAYEFVKAAIPCVPDSVILGYTQDQMLNLSDAKNRKFIWAHFVEKKLLYGNSKVIKGYTEERPYVAEMGPKVPGKIGCWLGWQIIQRYRKNTNNSSLQDLMSNDKAAEIFKISAYRGD